MSDDRLGQDRNLRTDIHLYFPAGWRDRLLRFARLARFARRIETVKWITPALLAAIVGLLALQAFQGPTPAPSPPTPGPGPPPVVRPEPEPRPDPAPAPPPPPQPQPLPEVEPTPDSPLTRAAREYRDTLPQVFANLADAIESGKLTDKNAAVALHKQGVKQHAAALGAALDQVFSAGSDKQGKITDPGKIVGPLRETATALGAGRVRATAIPGGDPRERFAGKAQHDAREILFSLPGTRQ